MEQKRVDIAAFLQDPATVLLKAQNGASVAIERDGEIIAWLSPHMRGSVGEIPIEVAREDGVAYAVRTVKPEVMATALMRVIDRPAVRKTLGVFILDPERRLHQREVARRAELGLRSAQIALGHLEQLGLLVSERDGNRRYYRANRSEAFDELRNLLGREIGLPSVIARALAPFESRIRWAAIFGSLARGDDRVGSDVDLLIVGDVAGDELAPAIADAERELGRRIDLISYSPQTFCDRRNGGNHFVKSLLEQPTIDLIGSSDDA
jgi:predicted nucleotidyltransferase